MIRTRAARSLLVLPAFLCAASRHVRAGLPVHAGDPPSRELLLELTAQPRLAGTCGSQYGAEVVARRLEQAGWQVEIDEREVLLSLPRTIELAIFDRSDAQKPLVERIDRFDPDALPPGDVPKCNGWSASGTVRASVVDAGRGLRADFERLKGLGLETRGTIALMRYGGSYRGSKVDLATEHGCAGALLFSDPKEDGPEKGPTWPAGPWKPDWDAQRGSISPMGRAPGDPSTPGWPSPKPGAPEGNGAKRISGEELAAALPTIPCIPIGWRDAKEILARLAPVKTTDKSGQEVEELLGPGPAQVRLLVDQPRDLRTIRNVIGRLPGESDETVIAGAHRDSWVRGANDDGAGTVATLRAAQMLGEKARAGWKPKSTILVAFWDAEEFGLIGSTEWGEANAQWLERQALAYVNSDTLVGGTRFRGASGSPGMLAVLKAVLERIPPATGQDSGGAWSLWEEWRASAGARDPAAETRLGLPGSGSDFAVFCHHLNLPVLEAGFGGSGGGGQYHATFDDFAFVEKHVDPGFVGHELAARLLAELLAEIAERGRACFSVPEAATEWARRAREMAKDVPDAERLALELDRIASDPGSLPDRRLLLGRIDSGLPGRPWLKNRLWAPSPEDGYGSETFPLLRSAMHRGEADARAEIDALVASLAPARPAEAGH